MSSFCRNCGSALKPGDRFCPNCGATADDPYVQNQMPYQPYPVQPQYNMDPNYALSVYHQFLNKLDSAATAWLVIGIIQLVIALFTIWICVGIVPLAVGIWNIIQSSRTKSSVRYLRTTSLGATSYVDTRGSGIAELLINIFLGTWLGIIAAAMDMSAISYGKNNRMNILYVEQNGLV